MTLELIYTYSPLVVVVSFLVSFVVNSILVARRLEGDDAPDNAHGPGGKPLPKHLRPGAGKKDEPRDFSLGTKTAFKWLNSGILLMYVLDAANAMSHTIIERKQHWWCGQAFVVSISCFAFPALSNYPRYRDAQSS